MNFKHYFRGRGSRVVRRFQILGGQQEKRKLMRLEHTLGFLVSVLGGDGYFKYYK